MRPRRRIPADCHGNPAARELAVFPQLHHHHANTRWCARDAGASLELLIRPGAARALMPSLSAPGESFPKHVLGSEFCFAPKKPESTRASFSLSLFFWDYGMPAQNIIVFNFLMMLNSKSDLYGYLFPRACYMNFYLFSKKGRSY